MTNARAGCRRAAGPSTALCMCQRGPGRWGGGQQRGERRAVGRAGSQGGPEVGLVAQMARARPQSGACRRRGAPHAPPTARAGWASEGAWGRGGQRLPSCSTGWCEHWGAGQGRLRIRQPSVALAFVMRRLLTHARDTPQDFASGPRRRPAGVNTASRREEKRRFNLLGLPTAGRPRLAPCCHRALGAHVPAHA